MEESSDSRTTREQDDAVESAVLRHLLHLHPAQLTLAELTRELAGEQPGFAERDAIERAVRDLSGAGLLHGGQELLVPSRAALRFSELLDP